MLGMSGTENFTAAAEGQCGAERDEVGLWWVPVLAKMCARCVFTVVPSTPNASAASRIVRPAAI